MATETRAPNPETSVEYEILPHAEARLELQTVFPNAQQSLWDAEFAVVKRASVDRFSHELRQEMFFHGIAYSEAFDCEDFSVQGWALAKRKHWRAFRLGQVDCKGVAVGLLCYHQAGDRSRAHCIMVIRTERGWEGYEPQRQEFEPLTAEERASAWHVLV